MSRIEVGRVVETWVYPVKGMQGISLDQVTAKSVSVVGDRRVAFTEINGKGTPTLLDTTQFPGLLRYSTRFENHNNPKDSEIIVKTPQGNEYSANDHVLLEQIADESGRKLAVLRMGRGAYHSMPVSMMSLGSVRQIDSLVEDKVDPRVFRQNIFIETKADLPHEEDAWLGKLIIFGSEPDSAKIVVVKLDNRCATVNLHPETGISNPNILKAIVKNHNNTLGVYCAIVNEGKVQVGSSIYLASLD